VVDEMAKALGMDPIEFRLKNAAREGTQTYFGPRLGRIGFVETLEQARAHPHYSAPLGPNQGRGIATGFWSNIGMETSASVTVSDDGAVTLLLGIIDVGGSRASMAMMVAEELGIAYDKVRPIVADTSSLGFNFITAGSRGTFAGGMASILATRDAIEKMKRRVAQIREVPLEAVGWRDGQAVPASDAVPQFEPMSLADIAKIAGKTGGNIAGHAEINAQGAGPGFATHIVDAAVDKQTGAVKIVRYTVVQDVGKAIHPANEEGQLQGSAVQGIGWALNEEYVYGEDGVLQNPGFLDYRMPVASDVPFIETVIVEVPNPYHPYGVRGCAEVSMTPAIAAIANAIANAVGIRLTELPMSPPRVLKALDAAAGGRVEAR
jgi:CO/xanthine dehydrogenase Mo-binding subunit